MNCHSHNQAVNSLRLFKNYIEHARQIHLKGNPHYYRRAYRLESLDKCERYYQYLKFINPVVACGMIPRFKKEMYDILPMYANSSYSATLKRLEDLLTLCETININKHEVRKTSYEHSN